VEALGKVYVLLKIYPTDVNVNFDRMIREISNSLPEDVRIVSTAEEPIAFGLKALKMAIIMPEHVEGGTSKIEEAVSKVAEVSQVEVEYVTRM